MITKNEKKNCWWIQLFLAKMLPKYFIKIPYILIGVGYGTRLIGGDHVLQDAWSCQLYLFFIMGSPMLTPCQKSDGAGSKFCWDEIGVISPGEGENEKTMKSWERDIDAWKFSSPNPPNLMMKVERSNVIPLSSLKFSYFFFFFLFPFRFLFFMSTIGIFNIRKFVVTYANSW